MNFLTFSKLKIENWKLLAPRNGDEGGKISAKQKGFTLIELMVVMFIATVMITVLVIQQNKWGDNLAINTQAYELALMIRQAQVYSLGVREYTGGGVSDNFDVVYGVYFNTSDTERNQYSFFVDKNLNYVLDSGEELETKLLNRGIEIDRLCGIDSNGNEKCSPQSGIRKVSISFYRPETKAIVKFINPGDNTQDSIYPPTKIFLKSNSSDKEVYVKVEDNGQISIVQ